MQYNEFRTSLEIELVLKHEGGDKLVDHPRDPGGLTKYGVSLRAYPALGRAGITALTKEQAVQLYWKDYYSAFGCSLLPRSMALLLFDACVNQGGGWAVKAMQSAIGNCTADGIVGPRTVKAVEQSGVRGLVQFAVARALRYCMSSAGFRENFKTFGKGWMTRLFETFAVAHALRLDAEEAEEAEEAEP